MTQNTEQISLTFDQMLAIVQQLSVEEKVMLSKELEKATLNSKLSELLECFKTDELSWETINEEVEAVRAEIYARKTGSPRCLVSKVVADTNLLKNEG